MSLPGTSRTSRDIRLESAKRAKADIRSGRAHLATYECLAYISDMSCQDSKRGSSSGQASTKSALRPQSKRAALGGAIGAVIVNPLRRAAGVVMLRTA